MFLKIYTFLSELKVNTAFLKKHLQSNSFLLIFLFITLFIAFLKKTANLFHYLPADFSTKSIYNLIEVILNGLFKISKIQKFNMANFT